MKQDDKFIDEIFSLLKSVPSSRKKISPLKKINKVLKTNLAHQSISQVKYITAHFLVMKDDKIIPKARVKWTDGKTNLMIDSIPRTNDQGWGMINFKKSDLSKLKTICLEITTESDNVTIPNINAGKIKRKLRIKGPNGFSILFDNKSVPTVKPKDRRVKKFTVALAGSKEQLEKALKLLEKHSCFNVKKIFVEKENTDEIKLVNKEIQVDLLGADIIKKLEGFDWLFNFTNNSFIGELVNSQVLGKRRIKTVIISDAARFLDTDKRLLSHFELKDKSQTNLDEIISQISKKRGEI